MAWIKPMLVTVGVSFLLAGCGPTQPMMFGIPKTQFEQLSPSQKTAVINQYNQQQAQKAKDQQVWNLIGAAGSLIHGSQTIEHSHSSHCSAGSCSSSGSSVSIGF